MGCTASKLDNEDTVRRCKDRRRLIKEAVFARHHLASAHADYSRSLRVTGSALSLFADGEPLLIVSPSTPSVLLNSLSSQKPKTNPSSHFAPPPPKSRASHVPPPPRSTSSPTIGSDNLPHILSSSSTTTSHKTQSTPNNKNEYNIHYNNNINNNHYNNDNNIKKDEKKGGMKIPHILSDSSVSSTPRKMHTKNSNNFNNYSNNNRKRENYEEFKYEARAAGTTYEASNVGYYPETPMSQGSSVWNWENFYPPPSPPTSEYFERREVEEEGGGREEVHCSEWGDRYSSGSSETESEEEEEEEEREREMDAKSEISETRSVRSEGGLGMIRRPAPVRVRGGSKIMEDVDEDEVSMSWKNEGGGGGKGSVYGGEREEEEEEEMRMVVRHKDLKEIVCSIKDYFDMAASAGDQVAEMLETGRAQLDRSFKQLKKTVYHSSGVFSNLSSSWTSKPPLAVRYRMDAMTMDEPGGHKSLCSTLERLLAWEKKLYEEVKAREGVKIEHERKLATLQSQEYKGEDQVKLDKTKTSIKKLQSLIIVTSQAVNTTSSAIVGLRDSDLIPQLVELCHGMMYMWRSMNQFHEVQNQIVQQVRGLVNQTVKGDSTSELHRQATRDLESAVSAWHSSFCRLIKYQRDFIRSLHGWFKLTLIPVDKEVTTGTNVSSEAFGFVEEWKLALDRLPDTVASEAIKSFVNVVHVISVKQTEEFKIKKRTETVSKELDKKASSLRNIEKKYYQSYSMVGLGYPDTGPDNGPALDARDPLAEKKGELAACQRKVEDEMIKHTKAVEVTRAMTLNNIQTGLPGVFQALTSFSSLFMEALEAACTRSYSIK